MPTGSATSSATVTVSRRARREVGEGAILRSGPVAKTSNGWMSRSFDRGMYGCGKTRGKPRSGEERAGGSVIRDERRSSKLEPPDRTVRPDHRSHRTIYNFTTKPQANIPSKSCHTNPRLSRDPGLLKRASASFWSRLLPGRSTHRRSPFAVRHSATSPLGAPPQGTCAELLPFPLPSARTLRHTPAAAGRPRLDGGGGMGVNREL